MGASPRTALWVFSLYTLLATAARAQSSYSPRRADPTRNGPRDTNFRVTNTLALGGRSSYDLLAVDDIGRRLYLARGSRIQVIDIDGQRLVGEVTNQHQTHAIVVVRSLNRGFATNAGDSSVTAFDLTSLAVTGRVHVTGVTPDALVYDPASAFLFAFNEESSDITIIDAKSMAVVDSLSLGTHAESAVVDGRGHLYVNQPEIHAVVVIDTQRRRRTVIWPLYDCIFPHAIALDVARHALIVGCFQRVAVVDITRGRQTTTLKIGGLADEMAYDSDRGLFYVPASQLGDTLGIVHLDGLDHLSVVARIPVLQGSDKMGFDRQTHRVFIPGTIPDSVAGQSDGSDTANTSRRKPQLQYYLQTIGTVASQ